MMRSRYKPKALFVGALLVLLVILTPSRRDCVAIADITCVVLSSSTGLRISSREASAFTVVAEKPASSAASQNDIPTQPRGGRAGEGGRSASGFNYKLALPGRKFSFPADHFSHPDFKTEWWYYTGHLETESGRKFGYQVTFFRFGVRDKQKEAKEPPLFTDLYMAHFALSNIAANTFIFRERINRGYGEKAGAATDRYLVWNEDWRVEGDHKRHRIYVNDRGTTLQLSLTSLKPPVLHGQNGLSQKAEGEGRASYYYSLTRMQADGELTVNGKKEKVRGLTWMDHEFGSNQLADNQVGWDWFSIQLDNQTELMLYLMRRKDGSVDPYSSGTLVSPNGTTKPLTLKDFRIEVLDRWKSPKSDANYPIRWKVLVPGEELELEVTPAFADQELITNRSTRVTYWEGAVSIHGTLKQSRIAGHGYVEMTGYAGKLTF